MPSSLRAFPWSRAADGGGTCRAGILLAALALGPVPAQAVTHHVAVQNKVFIPADLTLSPGDVVRWTWVDGIHTTTSGLPGSPDGTWDAPIDASNTFFERTFTTPGFYSYFCLFHFGTGMNGTITVTNNLPPVVQNPGNQSVQQFEFFTVTVTATDANGDPLTLSDLGTRPPWAFFVDQGNNSCTLSGTPGMGQTGTFPVSVRASDGLASDTESFNIMVGPGSPVGVDLTASGFVPASTSIQVGQSVRWVKLAGGNHTTTSGTGLSDPQAGQVWDAELRAASPEFTFQFQNSGTFPYFCRNHAAETGTVTVAPLPECLIVGPDPVPAGSNGNSYAASVSQGGGTSSYAWSITGNATIAGATTGSSVLVNATASGSFTLFLNGLHSGVVFSCQDPVTVSAGTGVEESEALRPLLRPTPNPFPSKVELHVDLEHASRVEIEIFDLQGKRVLRLLAADLPAGPSRVTWGGWDESHAPVAPGVYFARLMTAQGRTTVQRLFKTR